MRTEEFARVAAAVICLLVGAAGGAVFRWRREIAVRQAWTLRPYAAPLESRARAGVPLHPLQRWWLSQVRWHADEREGRTIVGAVGLAVVVLSLAGLLSVVVGFAGRSDPREAVLAQQSFDEAVDQPARSGASFNEVAAAFIQTRRASSGSEVRSVTFAARRQGPGCESNSGARACSPSNPERRVRDWTGDLLWEERREPGPDRVSRSCSVIVVLTAGGGWRIDGTKSCP